MKLFDLKQCTDIRPQNRRCLFTLHGHLDYVRTTQFHHEMPWIVSHFTLGNGDSSNLLCLVSCNLIAFLLG